MFHTIITGDSEENNSSQAHTSMFTTKTNNAKTTLHLNEEMSVSRKILHDKFSSSKIFHKSKRSASDPGILETQNALHPRQGESDYQTSNKEKDPQTSSPESISQMTPQTSTAEYPSSLSLFFDNSDEDIGRGIFDNSDEDRTRVFDNSDEDETRVFINSDRDRRRRNVNNSDEDPQRVFDNSDKDRGRRIFDDSAVDRQRVFDNSDDDLRGVFDNTDEDEAESSADLLESTEDEYIDDEISENASAYWGDLSVMERLKVADSNEYRDLCRIVDGDFWRHDKDFVPPCAVECQVFGIATYFGYVAVKNRFQVRLKNI